MDSVLFLLAAAGVLFYILKLDSPWVSIRIEMALAMIGVNYKPNKKVTFIVAAIVFYIVFGVIFDR